MRCPKCGMTDLVEDKAQEVPITSAIICGHCFSLLKSSERLASTLVDSPDYDEFTHADLKLAMQSYKYLCKDLQKQVWDLKHALSKTNHSEIPNN